MNDSPLVSVLIPTYNYAHYLDETIQSVLNQTYSHFELVIVDDGSKDNTDEVVEKYLSDGRISYYKNENNMGLVGNWNICLSHAKGKYIKYLCADDQFHPELLEKFTGVMEQYPNVSLVTSYKQSLGNTSNIVKLPLQYLHNGSQVIYHTLNTYGWLGEPSAVMFRHANVKKMGAFKHGVTWLPDWEMWLRQLTAGDCYIIPEPLALVRIHAGQLTKKVIKSYVNYFEEYQLCKDINEQNGYTIDTANIDIKKVVKKRAVKCANAMYKVLPKLYKKSNRVIFKKAFKIAFAEKVLLMPLANSIRKKIGIKSLQLF